MERYITEDKEYKSLKELYLTGKELTREQLLKLKATSISNKQCKELGDFIDRKLFNSTLSLLYTVDDITNAYKDMVWFERNNLIHKSNEYQLVRIYNRLLEDFKKVTQGKQLMFCDFEMNIGSNKFRDISVVEVIQAGLVGESISLNQKVKPSVPLYGRTKDLLGIDDDFLENAISQEDLVGMLYSVVRYSHGTLIFYGGSDKKTIELTDVKNTHQKDFVLKNCFDIQPLLNIKAQIISCKEIDSRLKCYMRGKSALSLSSLEMLCTVMPSHMHCAYDDSVSLMKVTKSLMNNEYLKANSAFIDSYCSANNLVFIKNKLINTKFKDIDDKWDKLASITG